MHLQIREYIYECTGTNSAWVESYNIQGIFNTLNVEGPTLMGWRGI